MALYKDKCMCTKCGIKIITARRTASIGKIVQTWCWKCNTYFKVKAGEPKYK